MDGPFTLAFVGYARGRADADAAYEDAVLPLLAVRAPGSCSAEGGPSVHGAAVIVRTFDI